MSESDGIDDAVESTLRAGLMAAARIGEQLAKIREQEQRNVQQAEEERARRLQDRFNAAQAAARAQLEPVSREDWWDEATRDMIERVHEAATAWKGYDPVAAEHAGRIRDQVQQRYGIDVNKTGAGEHEISAAVARAQYTRGQAENERSAAAAARGDEAVVAAEVVASNREDPARAADAGRPAWDSEARRSSLASRLEGNTDREAVNARFIADAHQGTHPSAAVQRLTKTAQTAKTKAARAQGRTAERDGFAR